MTQINLLPPEFRRRQRARRQTALVALAGLVVVAILFFVYFLQALRLSDVNEKLQAQQATNAQLQTEVGRLQRFAQLRDELEARKSLITGVLANTVRWSGVLRDVSLVLPDRMWLTSLTGTVQSSTGAAVAPPAGAPTTLTPGLIGSIQFEGESLDKPTIALWLTRLEEVRGWVNAWLSSAQEARIGATPVVSFSTSVDLSSEAAARGGGQL